MDDDDTLTLLREAAEADSRSPFEVAVPSCPKRALARQV